jgi:hypothetical protein
MKESYPLPYLLNKSELCMKDLKKCLIEVSPVYYGLKDNSADMMLIKITNFLSLNSLKYLTPLDSTPIFLN